MSEGTVHPLSHNVWYIGSLKSTSRIDMREPKIKHYGDRGSNLYYEIHGTLQKYKSTLQLEHREISRKYEIPSAESCLVYASGIPNIWNMVKKYMRQIATKSPRNCLDYKCADASYLMLQMVCKPTKANPNFSFCWANSTHPSKSPNQATSVESSTQIYKLKSVTSTKIDCALNYFHFTASQRGVCLLHIRTSPLLWYFELRSCFAWFEYPTIHSTLLLICIPCLPEILVCHFRVSQPLLHQGNFLHNTIKINNDRHSMNVHNEEDMVPKRSVS